MSYSSSSVTPTNDTLNLYDVLDTSPTSSTAEIKQAYHRALLRYHPDKQRYHPANGGSRIASTTPLDAQAVQNPRDVHILKHAYLTLSDPASRTSYDDSLRQQKKLGPRPAEIVSLHEFTEDDSESNLAGDGVKEVMGRWTYLCRCGGMYVITEKEMEEGQHLIGCLNCSEVIWVGYEAVEDEEEES